MKKINLVISSVFITFLIGCASEQPPYSPVEDKINSKGDEKGKAEVVSNWITKDITLDGVAGTSADTAYTLSFVKPTVAPIIVAIVDSGVDIHHVDLSASIWVNEAERKGQPGIDDDRNGYVDDLNGWNFLGSYDSKGQATFISQERLEVTRETARLRQLRAFRESQGGTLTPEEQAYFDKTSKIVVDQVNEANTNIAKTKVLRAKALTLVSQLSGLNGIEFETLTLESIQKAPTHSSSEDKIKAELLTLMQDNRLGSMGSISRRIDYYETQINYYFNESFDPRAKIIGDQPDDFKKIGYGNNVVVGPLNSEGEAEEASHGTHVAGIIGATRNNGIGVDGVARDVRFMSLRAVPDGDEYDKDVANSIRYAVNNGAKIINMSFGKGFSPYKAEVDAAFAYAASKNVLLVHAAGNESSDNDVDDNFPNRFPVLAPTIEIPGWIEVGASSSKVGEDLVAEFSNFGLKAVHLFAPGVNVWSTIPGNKYDSYSGTSMASPTAAGVAAFVWSQFPTLSAQEVKQIVMDSVVPYLDLQVKSPQTGKLVAFNSLSQTGGIANAKAALIRACEYTGGKACY